MPVTTDFEGISEKGIDTYFREARRDLDSETMQGRNMSSKNNKQPMNAKICCQPLDPSLEIVHAC